MKRGKTKIGIIFNTDPHDKPGQHWISMFINIKKKKALNSLLLKALSLKI